MITSRLSNQLNKVADQNFVHVQFHNKNPLFFGSRFDLLLIFFLQFMFGLGMTESVMNERLSISHVSLSRQLLQVSDRSCALELVQFREQCDLDKQNLTLSVSDNSISTCCLDNGCCDQVQSLLQSGCIDECTSDHGILELAGLYTQICPFQDVKKVQLKECESAKKVPKTGICAVLNKRMVQNCGAGVQGVVSYNQSEEDLLTETCCWKDTCCDQASTYISMGCLADCEENYADYDLNYTLGNVLAKYWSNTCSLEVSSLTACDQSQWIQNKVAKPKSKENFNRQDITVIEPTMESKPSQSSNTQLSPTTFVTKQMQNDTQQQQQLRDDVGLIAQWTTSQGNTSNATTTSRGCGGDDADGLELLYGPQFIWNATAFSFCGLLDASQKSLHNSEFELCCSIIQELVDGKCKYQDCYPDQPLSQSYEDSTEMLIQTWNSACNISAYPCTDERHYRSARLVLPLEAEAKQQTSLEADDNTQQFQFVSLTDSSIVLNGLQPIVEYSVSIYPVINLIPMLSIFSALVERFGILDKYSQEGKLMFFAPTNKAFSDLSTRLDIPDNNLFDDLGDLMLSNLLLQHTVILPIDTTPEKSIIPGTQVTTLNEEPLVFSAVPTTTDNSQYLTQVKGCCASYNIAQIVYGVRFQDSILWLIDSVILTPELYTLVGKQ
eukprot:TRINITY_DN2347_c0_g2_i1.p1 TRINITY_DN2347_c0_g2~~TRINITY_DN2347_c0_g2_i1.p1  ORF type:complete len:666 (-),score=37.04 TRINITY_DN2347_c0_g2_i1:3233-5230(-)